MRDLDLLILGWLNSFARESYVFDKLAQILVETNLIKAAPLVACLWWVWFSEQERETSRRAVFSALIGGFIAVACSLLWQHYASERPRPRFDPSLNFVAPFGEVGGIAADWSSFPSDTTALAIALATGIWLRSRAVGVAALLWAVFITSLPRVYTGLHYPSDMLAGGILGVMWTALLFQFSIVRDIYKPLEWLRRRHAGVFYAFAFLVTHQTATYFVDLRRLLSAIGRFVA